VNFCIFHFVASKALKIRAPSRNDLSTYGNESKKTEARRGTNNRNRLTTLRFLVSVTSACLIEMIGLYDTACSEN